MLPAPTHDPMVLAIGPEGGWVPFEVELLEAHGFQRFTSGPRVLRVDTAVSFLLGQLALCRVQGLGRTRNSELVNPDTLNLLTPELPCGSCDQRRRVGCAGLAALKTLAQQIGDVYVLAPRDPHSYAGHRVTTDGPMVLAETGAREFTLGGTPADCVRVGHRHLVPGD